MKRYLFFIGTLCNGGAERVVSILASHMAKKGMPVEVLTYYDRPVSYELDPNVKLTALETMTGSKNRFKNLIELRKYFRKNAKVVISFLAPFNMMSVAANLGNKIPLIVADRNDPAKVPSNSYVRKLRDISYRFADGVVVQTQKNKAYFSETVQKKSHVIYNPIDLREKAGIALEIEKKKKIVTAGRLMPQKNQKMMIRAFAETLKVCPDYELFIYGEGPSREELEALVHELGLEEKVKLPGNVTDIHERIQDAEFFVLSSKFEGMPNALIEAMCLGLSVISTKVSGATDLIKDHENGLLTENNDQAAMTKAMLEFMQNKELCRSCAKKAVQLNDDLEIGRIMGQWIEFIEEITVEK